MRQALFIQVLFLAPQDARAVMLVTELCLVDLTDIKYNETPCEALPARLIASYKPV